MSLSIVGAGLSGLIAAHAWPQARVFESSAQPNAEHKALLRFRSDAVAKLTGIDFRKVTVRKGVWLDGGFVPPSIRAANMYAQKVTGSLSGDRSIWNLDPVERFIAPESIYDDLLANVQGRITWGVEFDFSSAGGQAPIVNTAPLPIVLERTNYNKYNKPIEFKRAPIVVERYRVEGADIYQTIYFPWPGLPVYRASMTGSLLIIERVPVEEGIMPHSDMLSIVADAFALKLGSVFQLDVVEQKYGKIVPLPDAQRKALLHRLTQEHGIFSLGRFATWRNILLDDVVQDIAVLRRLMKASNYDRRIFSSNLKGGTNQ